MCKDCCCSYCLTGTGGNGDLFLDKFFNKVRRRHKSVVIQAIEKSSFPVTSISFFVLIKKEDA